MENLPPRQRVCTSCGFSKPLSAFLYISSTRGTTYGSLCATCRGTQMSRGHNPLLGEDDSGSTRSGLRIGAREKAHYEKEWGRKLEEKKQQNLEEKKLHEELKKRKLDHTEQKQEEKRRKSADEALSTPSADKTKPAVSPTKVQDKTVHPSDPETLIKEKTEKDKKEQRLGGTLVNIDPQQTTVARMSAAHQSFLTFLGESSAAGSAKVLARRARSQQLFSGNKVTNETPGIKKGIDAPTKETPGFQKKK